MIVKKLQGYYRHTNSKLKKLYINWLTSNYSIGGDFKRIYHYHIRKTAGTSLNSAFWGLAGLDLEKMGKKTLTVKDNYVFLRGWPEEIQKGNYFFANSHIPAHQLSLPPETFTITVLRKPVSRVVSYYRYLLWAQNSPTAEAEDPHWNNVFKEGTQFLGESFDNFLDRVPPQKLMPQLYCFSKEFCINEAVDHALSCSAILFTEDFSDGILKLGQTLNLPLREKKERSFSKAINFQMDDLNRDRLLEMLQDELTFISQVQTELAKKS